MPVGIDALRLGGRKRAVVIGALAVLVALVATAFAVGGSDNGTPHARPSNAGAASVAVAGAAPLAAVGNAVGRAVAPRPELAPGTPVRQDAVGRSGAADSAASTAASSGSASGSGSASSGSASGSSLAATRIVKTGNLTIRVPRTHVREVTQSLTALATAQGGYVSRSSTELGAGAPYGEVVLRIPVAKFGDAITAAEKLGHVVSLTTSADDVTGKYVDLSAKKRALERTRETYLTILSRARTIGATLAVQQRIDDVQQQIDQLHGQLKLLGNQSSYSTLTVDVAATGAAATTTHPARHGIAKAWHDSWNRFDHGINALVGAIGPIVFAVLLLALLGAAGLVGYRGLRRFGRVAP